MTTNVSTRGDFPVSPDRMLAIMTDHELVSRRHRQQGALEVGITDRREGEHVLVQEVALREYHRTMRGIDPDKVVDAHTSYRWDLDARICTWRYRGDRGEQVQIDGRIAILPAEQGAEVQSEVQVKVPVPLIGSVIEKRIAREIDEGFAPFEKLLREFCARVDGGTGDA